MRVVHIAHSDRTGGASIAAWRLHRALVDRGIDSRMLVMDRRSDDPRVEAVRLPMPLRVLRRQIVRRGWDERVRRGLPPLSFNLVRTGIVERARALPTDIVHLHWLGFETASVGEIARAGVPTVWTLHDMWAFGGAQHYEPDTPDALWRTGAGGRVSSLESWNWRRKARAWRAARFAFVTPSRWLAGVLAESALLREQRAAVIPNVIDLDLFRPHDPRQARTSLGLPPDRPVVLFGAVGGLDDPRKGGQLLLEALGLLPTAVLQARPVCCVFGQDAPARFPALPLEMRWLGRLQPEALPRVYSAADVMVVPSLVENLAQTGVEAQACGCPVATFDATGLPELIEDRVTGALARSGSARLLADAIAWCLEPGRRESLGPAARRRAEHLWSPEATVGAYEALYRNLCDRVAAADA